MAQPEVLAQEAMARRAIPIPLMAVRAEQVAIRGSPEPEALVAPGRRRVLRVQPEPTRPPGATAEMVGMEPQECGAQLRPRPS